jgi:prevent-host-death family protein
MRAVSVSDARTHLSALLRDIRGGHTVIITNRGTPVALLTAVPPVRAAQAAALGLAQRGRLRRPGTEASLRWLDPPRVMPTSGQSAVAVLLDERECNW